MPLPTLSVPTYDVALPSTGKKIKYRPFLVKEEKVLLLAMESEDTKEIETAVKQTLNNCIQTRGVKVESLASFDLEYLFLRIRAVSAGQRVHELMPSPRSKAATTAAIAVSSKTNI